MKLAIVIGSLVCLFSCSCSYMSYSSTSLWTESNELSNELTVDALLESELISWTRSSMESKDDISSSSEFYFYSFDYYCFYSFFLVASFMKYKTSSFVIWILFPPIYYYFTISLSKVSISSSVNYISISERPGLDVSWVSFKLFSFYSFSFSIAFCFSFFYTAMYSLIC